MKSRNISELYGNKGSGLKYGPGTQPREKRAELGTGFVNWAVQGSGRRVVPQCRLQEAALARGSEEAAKDLRYLRH